MSADMDTSHNYIMLSCATIYLLFPWGQWILNAFHFIILILMQFSYTNIWIKCYAGASSSTCFVMTDVGWFLYALMRLPWLSNILISNSSSQLLSVYGGHESHTTWHGTTWPQKHLKLKNWKSRPMYHNYTHTNIKHLKISVVSCCNYEHHY